MRRSLPILALTRSSRSSVRSRSAAQTLRPSITPADSRALRQGVQDRVELSGRAHEIHVELGELESRDSFQRRLVEAIEVGCEADADRLGRQRFVRLQERIELRLAAIERQARLVQLHLGRSGFASAASSSPIDLCQGWQQGKRVRAALREQQQRERSHHYRAGGRVEGAASRRWVSHLSGRSRNACPALSSGTR